MSKKFDDFILEESFVTVMDIKRKVTASNAGIKCNAGITINVKPDEKNKKLCFVVLRATITGENDMLSTMCEMVFKIMLKDEKEAEKLAKLQGSVASDLYDVMNGKIKKVTDELYENGMELPPLSAIVK
ncbi:MAG: hypothetical protein IJA36_03690 [Lachnospiraceae bacterium]|nr:hypothetical protein [Lachnospiraceae bacterium]